MRLISIGIHHLVICLMCSNLLPIGRDRLQEAGAELVNAVLRALMSAVLCYKGIIAAFTEQSAEALQ